MPFKNEPTTQRMLSDFIAQRLPTYPRRPQSARSFSFSQGMQVQPRRQAVGGNSIIQSANSWLGVPYKWGGTSRSGTDCSGLTYQVAKSQGKSIPRTAKAQYQAMQKVSDPQPGDFVFVRTRASQGYHVGIYAGGGQFINAPRTGDVVKLSPLSGRQIIGFTRL